MVASAFFSLALLFGFWLAVVAGVVCFTVRREAGGQLTPRVRALTRQATAVGAWLVVAYLAVALPASRFVPVDVGYSIIVGAFAVAVAVQAAYFLQCLVVARRLRLAGPQPA